MSALDKAWAILTGAGPAHHRSEAFRNVLPAAPDGLALVLGCVERLAAAAPALRAEFGTMIALQAAARTPPDDPLDPRLDAVVGLVPRAFGHGERVYGRIPRARLAAILTRVFAERPKRDDDNLAHDMVAALQRAPEATPAFVAYLRARKQLRRVEPGGDLAASFEPLRAAAPELAAAPKAPRARAPKLGPFTIVEIAEVRAPAEVEALGPERAAQFLAAVAVVVGRKPASLKAAFARPLRDGEAGLVAQLHEVRDGEGLRYELWVVAADTGVLFTPGTTKRVAVDWIQGAFEAGRAAHAALAQALDAATWR